MKLRNGKAIEDAGQERAGPEPSGAEPTFVLFVKTPDGKSMVIDAAPSASVGGVVGQALSRSACCSLSLAQVYIHCGGHHVEPHTTLAAAGAGPLSTLHVAPNIAAIRALPSLCEIATELFGVCAGGALSPERLEKLEKALQEHVGASQERGCVRRMECVQELARSGIMQALSQLRFLDGSNPMITFGLRWLMRCVAAVRLRYVRSLEQVPRQLAPAQQCLHIMLGTLLPLLSHRMAAAGRGGTGRWTEAGSLALEELCQLVLDTEQSGATDPALELCPAGASTLLQLYACVASQLAALLELTADNMQAAARDMQNVCPDGRDAEQFFDSYNASIQLLLLLDTLHTTLPLSAAFPKKAAYLPVCEGAARLCHVMARALDSMHGAAGQQAAGEQQPAVLHDVIGFMSRWSVKQLSLLSRLVTSASLQLIYRYGGTLDRVQGVASHPAMQAALQDIEAWEDLASVYTNALLRSHIPPQTRLWYLRQVADSRRVSDEEEDLDSDEEEDDGEPATIVVRRDDLLESSYAELLSLRPRQLNGELTVTFQGEPGHGPGVVREWLRLLLPQLLAPQLGLFARCSGDPRAIIPSSTACVQPQCLDYLQVAGRAMGLALLHGVPLQCRFATAFHSALAEEECTGDELLEQLKEVDPQMWRSLRAVLEAEEASQLHLTFSLPCDFLGQTNEVALGDNPAEPVTNANRAEYVGAAVRYLLRHNVLGEVDAVRQGLISVLKQCPTQLFGCDELNTLVEGAPASLSAQQWRQHTRCSGWGGWGGPGAADGMEVDGAAEEPEVLRWLWMLVGAMHEEQRAALLRFWTCLPCLPAGGFGALPQPLRITRADAQTQPLPVARTCFFELLLPDYPDVLSLAGGLKEAIAHAEGFGLA